jgi:phasin family protein
MQVSDQFANWSKAQLETFNRVAEVALHAAEDITNLQLTAARETLADTVEHARAVADARDAQEVAQLNTRQIQPTLDKVAGYVRNMYQIGAAAQSEITKIVEQKLGEFNGHVAQFNDEVGAVLERAVKSGPAGSEVAVAAVKSAIAATNSAYGNLSRAAKQVVNITEANIARANEALTTKQHQSA